jgi:hypothetical protein
MARRKRIGDSPANYIIPIAVVLGGIYLWSKFSNLFTTGTAGGAPSNVPGSENLSAQGQINTTAWNSIEAYQNSDDYTGGQSCFTPYLYNQTPANATISMDTANTLWNDINSATTFWIWNCASFDGILANFQAACVNQTDVSMVASLHLGGSGKYLDLLTFITSEFGVACESGSGQDNPVQILNFVNWATGLPVS